MEFCVIIFVLLIVVWALTLLVFGWTLIRCKKLYSKATSDYKPVGNLSVHYFDSADPNIFLEFFDKPDSWRDGDKVLLTVKIEDERTNDIFANRS